MAGYYNILGALSGGGGEKEFMQISVYDDGKSSKLMGRHVSPWSITANPLFPLAPSFPKSKEEAAGWVWKRSFVGP